MAALKSRVRKVLETRGPSRATNAWRLPNRSRGSSTRARLRFRRTRLSSHLGSAVMENVCLTPNTRRAIDAMMDNFIADIYNGTLKDLTDCLERISGIKEMLDSIPTVVPY